MKYINLFEILDNKGAFGLIEYLKSRSDAELKVLANQYSIRRSIKAKDDIIIGILSKLEKTLNKGYVFTINKHKYDLASLYK